MRLSKDHFSKCDLYLLFNPYVWQFCGVRHVYFPFVTNLESQCGVGQIAAGRRLLSSVLANRWEQGTGGFGEKEPNTNCGP